MKLDCGQNPQKKIMSGNFSHAVYCLLDFLNLEDETNRLFPNVDKELLLCAAWYLTRAQISHDYLVLQALVWHCMVWFTMIQYGAIQFCTSYANFKMASHI